ncbi:flagellar hook-length control protein FliK [Roseburia sp. AM16-25]|uniref:flagellar hook-length control protein FliK n=1 Tax=Roseburia sp. AM16-25 TaxID=2292065 RepID=UPI000E511EA8|nr:flagellar hook-length control protein FliK [Roseburia sp. AM16-25]RHO32045.1 flagellar hook-length control protein FliK [Roseburia sp. AM16-25]
MTSTGIANILMPTATVANAKQTSAKDASGGDFRQMMQMQKSSAIAPQVVQSADNAGKIERAPQMENKRSDVSLAKQDDKGMAQTKDVKDKTDAFAKDVKDAIKDELDVTDEQIEKAMEDLGLQFLDLTDQSNLAALVTKLSGSEDSASLLVSDAFPQIVLKVNDLAGGLQEDLGISMEDLQQMAELVTTDVEEAGTTDNLHEPAKATEGAEETMQKTEDVKDTVVAEEATEQVEIPTEETIEPTKTDETDELVTAGSKDVTTEKQTDQGQEDATDQDTDAFLKQQTKTEIHPTQDLTPMQAESPITEFASHMEPTVELPTGESVSVQSIIDQIVEASRTTMDGDKTTVEMLLHPEGLGKVLMEVTEENGQVRAHIYTQNEQVKEALENQMFQLKEQMNQSQTKVQSVEISVGTHEFERNLEAGQQNQEQGQEGQNQRPKKMRNLNMNDLDDLQGLMTQEEELVTKMMRDQGNTVNYTA